MDKAIRTLIVQGYTATHPALPQHAGEVGPAVGLQGWALRI
jgi:hypothetical protein